MLVRGKLKVRGCEDSVSITTSLPLTFLTNTSSATTLTPVSASAFDTSKHAECASIVAAAAVNSGV